MVRHILHVLIFFLAITAFAAPPALRGQQIGPLTPPATTSQNAPGKGTSPATIEEAEGLYRRGEFDKAIERYKEITADGANHAVAYTGLARAYLKVKKPDDAYRAATKAIEQDPSLGAAHTALGEVYFRQGKLPEAQTEFLTALKIDPMDARSDLGLSRFYQATYDFQKAKLAIDKAHLLDPGDPEIGSAWVETRPRLEQLKALEDNIASEGNYYSRAAKAGFKQRLALMSDEIEHPERTCRVAGRIENTEVRLVSIGRKKQFTGLEVRVNDVASRLVLSTVSSGIVINGRIAEEAGVQPIARADIDALGEQNPPEVYIGFARSLKFKNLEFQNCYVTVVKKVSPLSFYDQYEGLIAAGFFYPYVVDIDVPQAKLRLQPLPSRPPTEDRDSATIDSSDPDAKSFHDRYTAPEMMSWTKMFRFGSAIVVPARVNNSPSALFEIAASSEFSVLAPEFAHEWASLQPAKVSAGLEGINGKVSSELTGQVKLDLADLHFGAIRAISFDDRRVSENAETEIAGYLGFDLLHILHFTIDYRDGLIHLEKGQPPE
jgi:tetratricopeptide (TPR) repeat protein